MRRIRSRRNDTAAVLRRCLMVLVTFLGVSLATPASTEAQGGRLEEVSSTVLAKGWFNEVGAGTEDERLAEIQARLAGVGSPWGLVALAENPAPSTKAFGDELLDLVRAGGGPKTVVILTPTEVSASSRTYDEATLQAALATAVPAFDRDVVAGFETLFAELTDGPAPARPAPETSFPVVAVAGAVATGLAAVVLVVAGFRRRPSAR